MGSYTGLTDRYSFPISYSMKRAHYQVIILQISQLRNHFCRLNDPLNVEENITLI